MVKNNAGCSEYVFRLRAGEITLEPQARPVLTKVMGGLNG
jgi:hypothetical protein